jgi:hypothetical protein
MCTTSLYAPA